MMMILPVIITYSKQCSKEFTYINSFDVAYGNEFLTSKYFMTKSVSSPVWLLQQIMAPEIQPLRKHFERFTLDAQIVQVSGCVCV